MNTFFLFKTLKVFKVKKVATVHYLIGKKHASVINMIFEEILKSQKFKFN